MFADFLGVCFDQIVNNAAKLNYMFQGKAHCGITIRTPQGGGIRCAYHHSANVESWFANVPGLIICCPTTPYEAKGMLISAIKSDNPVLFLEHKGLYNVKGEVPEEMYDIPLCKAEIEREGTDITIVATQIMLAKAHKAAEELAKEGVSVEVIDLRTVAPYDKETIKNSVAKTGRLVLAQEGVKNLGWAAEVSAMVNEELFEYLKAPIKRSTSLDSPVPFAPGLEDYVAPQYDHLLAMCREVMEF